LMTDAKGLFGLRCAPCHGASGQGLIGPNLTDSAWVHGKGTLTDIYGVVEGGVAAKGMPAWGRQLTPIELRKVVGFVGTLRGTNVPGKAAEGTQVP
jgi:cytochrome c oxidase cbb3-type subunit III